jgi:hypothetical protein
VAIEEGVIHTIIAKIASNTNELAFDNKKYSYLKIKRAPLEVPFLNT